jgi:antitoxin PrlF
MANTLTVKGQVTIPKQIRDNLGLVAGNKIEFSLNEAGEYVLLRAAISKRSHKPNVTNSRFDAVRGSANLDGMTTDTYMNLIRGYEQDSLDAGFSLKPKPKPRPDVSTTAKKTRK